MINQHYRVDIEETPNLLLIGGAGTGKSSLLIEILRQLDQQYRNSRDRFLLIDSFGAGTFDEFRNNNRVKVLEIESVIDDNATSMFYQTVDDELQTVIKELANRRSGKTKEQDWFNIFIFWDKLADPVAVNNISQFESYLHSFARWGGKYHVYTFCGTRIPEDDIASLRRLAISFQNKLFFRGSEMLATSWHYKKIRELIPGEMILVRDNSRDENE